MTAESGLVPQIDVAGLLGGESDAVRRVAREVGAAARTSGFFALVNHGIDAQVWAAMFAAAREFFALPDAQKERVSMANTPHYRGYSRLGAERLDPNLPGDVKESFNIGLDLAADDPEVLAGKACRGVNQWPELSGFRAAALTYYAALDALAMHVARGFAIDLGMPGDFFTAFYDRPLSILRLLRYPPHPGDFDGSLYGAGEHTDYGLLTLLAQDDAGGLEVRRRDGAWIAVEPVPGAFICNIGDALMRWSNDRYVSTPHRVVNRAARERFSIAFFADPDPDAIIACLPTCADAEHPAKYPPVSYADYQQARYDATYGVLNS